MIQTQVLVAPVPSRKHVLYPTLLDLQNESFVHVAESSFLTHPRPYPFTPVLSIPTQSIVSVCKRRRSAFFIAFLRRRGLDDEAVPFNSCALAPMAAEVARRMIPVNFMMNDDDYMM